MLTLMDLILAELNKGLSKKGNAEADMKCFITYIKDLPNGTGGLVKNWDETLDTIYPTNAFQKGANS